MSKAIEKRREERRRRKVFRDLYEHQRVAPITTEYSDIGPKMVVSGYMRGHGYGYGSVYQYYECDVVIVGQHALAIRFTNGCPIDFSRYSTYLGNGIYIALRPVDELGRRWFDDCFEIDFTRVRDSKRQRFVESLYSKKRKDTNEYRRAVSRNEIVEIAKADHKRILAGWLYEKIHSTERPKGICRENIKLFISGRYLEAWKNYEMRRDYNIKNWEEQTASESARQLRALGLVA